MTSRAFTAASSWTSAFTRSSAGAVTPLGAEATQLYALFNAQGHGGTDFSGIIRFLRGEAG